MSGHFPCKARWQAGRSPAAVACLPRLTFSSFFLFCFQSSFLLPFALLSFASFSSFSLLLISPFLSPSSLPPSFHPISRHLLSPARVPGAGTQVRSLSLCPCAGRARPTPASWRPCSPQGLGNQEGGSRGRGNSLQGREGGSVSPQARGPEVQSPFQRSFHLE